MAVKFETVKPGDVLYDVHSHRMGNTTLRTWGCWPVVVESVDYERGRAVVRWNGNAAETWYRHQIVRLRRKEPEFEEGFFGQRFIKRKSRKVDE